MQLRERVSVTGWKKGLPRGPPLRRRECGLLVRAWGGRLSRGRLSAARSTSMSPHAACASLPRSEHPDGPVTRLPAPVERPGWVTPVSPALCSASGTLWTVDTNGRCPK